MKVPYVNVLGKDYHDVTVNVTKYVTGEPAIQMWLDDGSLLATASINLDAYGLRPDPGCVFIKNYSEGRGIHRELSRLGLAEGTGRIVYFGRFDAQAYEMRLSEKLLADKEGTV